MSSEAPEEQDVAQAIRTALRGRSELPSEDAAEVSGELSQQSDYVPPAQPGISRGWGLSSSR